MENKNRVGDATRQILILCVCLLGIAVNCFVQFPILHSIVDSVENDFMGIYAASHLAGTDKLYSNEAVVEIERQFWTRPRNLPFARLPFYAAMVSPLRFLSYRHAYWLWQSISLLSIVVFVYFWPSPRRWVTAIACCWSMPLLDSLIIGQDLAFVLMVLAISLALFFGGYRFTAGCVLSLCLIKYNLFMAIPLLIAGKRLWRFGSGLAVGGAALLAISFAVGGISWPWHYAAMLPSTTTGRSGLANLHGFFYFLPSPLLAEAIGTCAVLIAAWLVIRGGTLARAISVTLVASMLISYHAYVADTTLMLPACLLMLDKASSLLRLVAILLLCPFTCLAFQVPLPFPPSTILMLPLLVMTGEEILARFRRASSSGSEGICTA